MTKVYRRRFHPTPPRRSRPMLEALEARLAPAAFHVDHLADDDLGVDGIGSLRYCIDQANRSMGADTIDFQVLGTVHLSSTLHITDSVSITGAGGVFDSLVTIQRDSGSPLFGLFDLLGSADKPTVVTMAQLTLIGGDAGDSNGGAIANRYGDLTLTACALQDNTAMNGGAVDVVGGSLSVEGSVIFRNHASNNGGGVSALLSNVAISDSLLQQNTADVDSTSSGGGLYAGSGSSGTIRGTRFRNNEASFGGGIGVYQASLSVQNCDLEQNVASVGDGGGIYANQSGTLTITESSIHDGRGRNGAGLFVEGGKADSTTTLTNSTIAYNLATEFAGAIGTNATAGSITIDLNACTIVLNDARNPGAFSAVYAHSSGGSSTIEYRSTLFARNGHDHPGLGAFDAESDHLVSLGNNLSDDGSGITPGMNGDIQATPGLAPIGYYGGLPIFGGRPTQTVAILEGPGSIGGVNFSEGSRDQRGVSRPDDPSIGAFQLSEFVAKFNDGQTVTAYSDFAQPVGLQLSDNDCPIAGVSVEFTITSGSANFGGASSIIVKTDASGVASATPSAGPFEGPVTMTARVVAGEYGLPFVTDLTYLYTFTITPVENPPPNELVLTTSQPSVLEGEVFTLTGSFSDALLAESHSVGITWGDGKSETIALAANVFTFRVTHLYTTGLPSTNPAELPITAVVHDSRDQTVSGFSSVIVANVPPVLEISLADRFIHNGETFTRIGTFADAGNSAFMLSVDYGDGIPQPLNYDPTTRTFTLSHVYQSEGTYPVTVVIDDGRGGHDAVRFEVDVLLAGVPTDTAVKAKAEPGTAVTVTEPGVSVTLFHALVPGLPTGTQFAASLIVAVVPAGVASALDGPTTPGGTTITTSYDIRAINVGVLDYATVVFHYENDDSDEPTLTYYDRLSGQQRPVDPRFFVVDRDARTISLTLNRFSTPRLMDLTGTVFTIAVPITVPVSNTFSRPPEIPILPVSAQLPGAVAIIIPTSRAGSGSGFAYAVGQLVGHDLSKEGTNQDMFSGPATSPPAPADDGTTVPGVLADLPPVPEDLITLPGPILTPGSSEVPSVPEEPPALPANVAPAPDEVRPVEEAVSGYLRTKDEVFTRLATDPFETLHGDGNEDSSVWSGLTLAAVAILVSPPQLPRREKSPFRSLAA